MNITVDRNQNIIANGKLVGLVAPGYHSIGKIKHIAKGFGYHTVINGKMTHCTNMISADLWCGEQSNFKDAVIHVLKVYNEQS